MEKMNQGNQIHTIKPHTMSEIQQNLGKIVSQIINLYYNQQKIIREKILHRNQNTNEKKMAALIENLIKNTRMAKK